MAAFGRFHAFGSLSKVGFALALVAAIAGCGLDEHYTGMGSGALPGDKLYKEPEPIQGCEIPEGASTAPLTIGDLAGTAFRFATLELTPLKPLPEDIVGMVNPVVQDQLDMDQINLLLVIDTDDRGAGLIKGRLGPADGPTDGAYTFVGTPQNVTFTMTLARFDSDGTSSIDISVAMGDAPLVLPIKALRLAGVISPDGKTVTPALLIGAITEEDGANVNIPVFGTLKDFLGSQNPPITTDTDVDGKPAWTFQGCFTMESVTFR